MIPELDIASFQDLASDGGIVPVARTFSADTLTPVGAYAAIARPPFGFLLESLVGGERWARYTFLGTEPREAWRYREGSVSRWTPIDGWGPPSSCRDPLAHLADQLRSNVSVPVRGLPPFTGGAVGYLGYDTVRAIESLPGGPSDDLALPDAVFVIADALVVIDNALAQAIVIANARCPRGASAEELRTEYARATDRIDTLLGRLHDPPRLAPLTRDRSVPLDVTSPYPRDDFERDIRHIKERIAAGDVYQAVLSRRQDVRLAVEPFRVYRALRALNPAPYLYLLDLDDVAVVGSSPEVLVRVQDGEVTVRPIAGTRPRGQTEEEDIRLGRELLADEKELAEHAMLVDLGRNDVGRVAEYGTVRVTEHKVIERYSHVQHIVSEVRGRLRPDLDAIDTLRACFPAGTVSGAPKIRAMQILDELEPTRRGPYAGAICHIGWGGTNLDTAITIRSAVLAAKNVYVQAGAGIVADSDPAREFEETQAKASAVLDALAIAAAE